VGVLALGWDLAAVLLLYWAESGVIGLSSAAKMVVVGRWRALLMVPFFVFHFGFFMFGHLLFILLVFVARLPEGGAGEVVAVAGVVRDVLPAVVALLLAHAGSFWVNFLRGGERYGTTVEALMVAPYLRVFLMQVVLVVGGAVALWLRTPQPALVLLVILKVVVDLRAHRKKRARHRPRS
jgi:hypothetical protein